MKYNVQQLLSATSRLIGTVQELDAETIYRISTKTVTLSFYNSFLYNQLIVSYARDHMYHYKCVLHTVSWSRFFQHNFISTQYQS
jgi:hypothetical protein